MNIAQLLADSASAFPEKRFAVFEDQTITYGQFYHRVLRGAQGLRKLGVKPGDRVIIYGYNSLNWVLAELALLSAGAVLVTLNPQYKFPEIEYIVNHSEANTIFVDPKLTSNFAQARAKLPSLKNVISFGHPPMAGAIGIEELIAKNEPLWAPIHREGDDPEAIFYTSGTTGKPKGVIRRHETDQWASATFVRAWFKPDDVVLIMMPLAFAYASVIELLPAIRIGATCVLVERFHPKLVMEAIQKYRITLVEGVPTMYAMMLNFQEADRYDISSIRFVVSAGAVLPWEIAVRFKDKFGIPVIDYYGLVEGAPAISYDMTVERESKPNSCGRPFPQMEARVIDENEREVPLGDPGELLLKGPCVMKEYLKDKEATAQALKGGWLHTGDMAKVDEEGYFYIVDRKKDMIIRGGANIYPAEIEEVLYAHPKVAEAAVVGVPDPVFGEQVRAVVALKKGEIATKEEILKFCDERLAEYKMPKYLEIWDQLPKGPTDKILKRAIREIPLKANP